MLKKGIYEQIISQETEEQIALAEQSNLVCVRKEVDTAESPKMLAKYLSNLICNKLQDIEEQKDRVQLVNTILSKAGLMSEAQISDESNLLTEVMSQQKSLFQKTSNTKTIRPLSGFNTSNLFTGGNSVLSLGEEIRREIASADEICLIVSFLKLSGLRIILEELRRFCERDNTKLRIITTTYCGVTEGKALQKLSDLPNTEIRISYNTNIERLHAKSYIFLRNSGLHTAYVGSSNLSKSAQTDGLEWNMRVTNVENPHIIKTAKATFDMYWNSPNFEDFNIGGIAKFKSERDRNKLNVEHAEKVLYHFSLLPHQKQILDKLKVEREELHNNRNLVVAATGTGKTVISAFDYLDFVNKHPRANILFTAHREEILKQSIQTYRSVLRDQNFGSLWVGNYEPKEEQDYQHLFVSISMFNSKFESFFSEIKPDFYDYIVIDEAHHSQADSYRKLFSHFSPQILLGLTATPERMDGKDLRPDFGGRISAEIRLPEALQAGLLTPFQYLCVTDNVNLSDDSLWSGQRYIIDQLSKRLCSEQRAGHIIGALHKYLSDEYTCRALCFCVNKEHARYMAEQFKINGFAAESLTDATSKSDRDKYAKDLREGRIHYLFVVDIYNEGVDIPEVDTVLFLRPTESLTIFLQQLGRGLRLAPGKDVLTVLDFVAQAHRNYDFSSRFRALSTQPQRSVAEQVEKGFAYLPMGSSIIMEKKAKEYILDNIKNAIYRYARFVKELRLSSEANPQLASFLESNGQDIRLIYRGDHCWTSLKRDAGKISYEDDQYTKRFVKGIGRILHHNTPSFLHFIELYLQDEIAYKDSKYEKYALMLYYDLFQEKISRVGLKSMYEGLDIFKKVTYFHFQQELKEVVSYLIEHLQIKTNPFIEDVLPGMELYGCYTKDDIWILSGQQTEDKTMQGSAAGVFTLKDKNTILLFVTLNKSEKDFSPSTQYNDYVINENFFHWQSQNMNAHDNEGGLKFVQQKENNTKIILFVRDTKKDAFGDTSPFHCFGLVDYVSSYGDKPMNVTWKLHEPVMAQYLKAI